jgi:ABC-type nitrate/sulfonate/bicarbonate transport system substrate-binding protein
MARFWRALLAGIAASAMALGVAACGGDDGGGGGSSSASQQATPTNAADVNGTIDPAKVKTKTMRVAVDNPHYLFQVDALVAQDKGYLKEYGIDSYKGTVTDTPIQAMIGGSVDMVLFDTDTLMAAARKTGEDIRIVGMYINQEANILGVRKGINSADDLKKVKAKIAVSGRGTRSFVQMEQMLKENGINPDTDVRLLDTGGQSNERLQQTLNGTVDGGSVQLRHETLLKEGGGKFLFKKVFDAPQLAWATTGDFLKKDPEGVAAFLAATLKARQDIVDPANKDSVLSLMEKTGDFELPPSFKDAYTVENAPDYRGTDGGFKTSDMDKLVQEQKAIGVIPKDVVWQKYVDFGPLWRAQKNLKLDLDPAPDAVQTGS